MLGKFDKVWYGVRRNQKFVLNPENTLSRRQQFGVYREDVLGLHEFLNDRLHFVHGLLVHRTLQSVIYFLWGYIKSNVCEPLLPKDLEDLKCRAAGAIKLIVVDMLQQVYEEFLNIVWMCVVQVSEVTLNICKNYTLN